MGRLQPSRSFGDLHLKVEEFAEHQGTKETGHRSPIRKFKGPYISYKPDI
jgi:hypothetical protein